MEPGRSISVKDEVQAYATQLQQLFDNRNVKMMKLDIEGSEYVVLPDLISSGTFCELDFVFGELHAKFAPWNSPGLNVDLTTKQDVGKFEQAMLLMMRGFSRTCKTRYEVLNDKAYLHNEIPLPILS